MTSRVRRTFWALVAGAIVAAGSLSTALRASPGRAAGLAVGVSGLVLTLSAALALRILLVAGRRPAGTGETPGTSTS